MTSGRSPKPTANCESTFKVMETKAKVGETFCRGGGKMQALFRPFSPQDRCPWSKHRQSQAHFSKIPNYCKIAENSRNLFETKALR